MSAPGVGTLIGRYVVLERIGEGGAGVVYAAFDPLLDRKVALKLVRRETDDDDDRVRTMLAREAQAMAKLAHPNVVAVHDVGAHSGGTFIAMELVDGSNVRAWLGEKKRPAKEIIEVFLQAGRGLAAAHAFGLVHRDFKPSNVLLGVDGRARVTDFGLARAPLTEDGATLGMTADGGTAPAGTPAYMAPEQRAGHVPDAKSDQYSYCVALFEALTGKLPQDAHAELPTVVRRILSRGLSTPDARYRSMNELLADLARTTRPRWPPVAGAVAALLAIAVAGLAYREGGKRRATALLCHAGGERAAEVWNDHRKAELARSFSDSRTSFAADAARAATGALDAYAAAWTAAYTDTCEATHVRGEQSAALLDTRMACLETDRKELAALVAQLARADATTVTNAVGAVTSLPSMAHCSDVPELTRAGAKPAPAIAATVDDIRARLATAHALAAVGHYHEARPIEEGLAREAEATGFRPLVAKVLLGLGAMQGRLGDFVAGKASLRRALFAADTAGDDRARATILVQLLHINLLERHGEAEALILRGDAEAAIERSGGDKRLRADLMLEIGTAYVEDGKSEEAIPVLTEATTFVADTDRSAAEFHFELGRAEAMAGRHDDAKREYETALRIAEKVLGPTHDVVGSICNGIGAIAFDEDRYAEAEAAMRRSIAIAAASLGEDNPRVADELTLLARILVASDRAAEAIAPAERALAIYDTQGLPKHAGHLYAYAAIGDARLARGENAAAIDALERALGYEPYLPTDRADVQLSLAKALTATKRTPSRARDLAAQAAATYDKEATTDAERAERDGIHDWLAAHGGTPRTTGGPR